MIIFFINNNWAWIIYKFDFIHRINNVTYELNNLETGEIYTDEEGNVLRGKKKDLEDYIMSHPAFQTEYLAMLNRYISGSDESYGDILDAREKAEIKEQEESVEAHNAGATIQDGTN